MDSIKRKLERKQGLIVPSVRRGGGLALLWKDPLTVDTLTYSPRHIDVVVTEEHGQKRWRFTGFYGYPETVKRQESWELLKQLSRRSDLPWICMGDFNELMHANEKEGGNMRPEGQMRIFREAINNCGLRDLGYCGADFTWSRKMGSRQWVRERLDRALVSINWGSIFPLVKLFHIANSISDHSILLLKESSPIQRRKKRKKLFRVESMWLRNKQCEEVVHDAWDRGQVMGSCWPLESCLEECRLSLEEWNKHSFGHVGKQISSLQKKLQILEKVRLGGSAMDELHATKLELNKWLAIEEDMWLQRSWNNWLKAGDSNTTFFHTKASNRSQRNSIQKVRDSNDTWHEDDDHVSKIFVEYYEQLFTSSQPAVEKELLDAIHTKVTNRMNAALLRSFQA